MSVYERLVVERVKGFLKWNVHRFHVLDGPPGSDPEPLDPWGWKRNAEYWIKPQVWREQLCAGEFDPQDVARALRGLDLLRTQDNLQVVVNVRGAAARAYVVTGAIFEWKPGVTGRNYGGYGSQAKLTLVPDDESPSVPAGDPSNELASPADLLQQGVVKGLRMAIDLLDLELDPSDRNYGTVLRAKTTLINTLLNTQTRVDEARLRARHSESLLPDLLKHIAEVKARLAAQGPPRTIEHAPGGKPNF